MAFESHVWVPSTHSSISNNKNKHYVWLIERDDNPVTEWTNNSEIIAGAFPFLFLRGYDMLPKSTFSEKLIRHLMLYYDGRFEKNQQFINLLFN